MPTDQDRVFLLEGQAVLSMAKGELVAWPDLCVGGLCMCASVRLVLMEPSCGTVSVCSTGLTLESPGFHPQLHVKPEAGGSEIQDHHPRLNNE